MVVHEITTDQLWPRDEEHRYRLYARRGSQLEVLAAAGTPGGVGVAIFQLDADEREQGGALGDLGAFGILDVIERRWVVSPWHRRTIGAE